MTKRDITDLSYKIIGHAITVHKILGPGLLESVYEQCLRYELENNGYFIKQQLIVPVRYGNLEFNTKLKIDLLVNDLIILELKATEKLLPIHEAQLITYMKLLKCPQGLLINFNSLNLTSSLKPFVNEYFKKLKEF